MDILKIISDIQNNGGLLGIMIYFTLEMRYLRRDFTQHSENGDIHHRRATDCKIEERA